MLKVSTGASASVRAASTEPSAVSSAPASSGFVDVLEAVQQEGQGAAAQSGDGKQTPRPSADGTPTATAGAFSPASTAKMPVTSRDRPDSDGSAHAKPDTEHKPDSAAADASAVMPAVVPDPLGAAAIAQAVASSAAQPDVTAEPDAVAPQPPTSGTAGPVAGGGPSSPSAAIASDVAKAADDATAELDLAETNSAAVADTMQSALSDAASTAMANQLSGLRIPTGVPSSGSPVGAGSNGVPVGLATQPTSAATPDSSVLSAAAQAVRSATPGRTSGSTAAQAGNSDVPAGVAAQLSGAGAASLSTLADVVQRMTGTGVDSISFAKGSRPGAPATSIEDPTATAADPATGTLADALASGPPVGNLEASTLLTDAGPAAIGLLGSVAGSATHRNEREAAVPGEGHEGHGSQAVDAQTVAIETVGGQAPAASAADATRPLPANGGATPSVASQVAPAVVAMAQGGSVGGSLSISITPDQLGQVHITVERATDGTTSIHVAADQLGTLDMLRHDQSDLTRALDQAGVGQDGHSLSFSWNGGGGGTQGWDSWGNQPNEPAPAEASGSYAAESRSIPAAAAAAARGGIDVTA